MALSPFTTQFSIGLPEGVQSAPDTGTSSIFATRTAFLAVGVAVFTHFAISTPRRPFAHAWLGLLLPVVVAFSQVALSLRQVTTRTWSIQMKRHRITVVFSAAIILASGFALAGRTHHREYAYFDSQGSTIGHATYPCYDPAIFDGDTSGTPVLEFEFEC